MILLRLFKADEPTREIDRRLFDEGELIIGRDPGAGWMIEDRSQTLSRRHCTLRFGPEGLMLRDDSTNGLAIDGERVPSGAPVAVRPGATINLGAFLLVAEPHAAEPAPAGTRPPTAPALDPALAGRLLESFCTGAAIDPSVFAGEDPSEVMRRAGALYRQMVTGVAELMHERTRAKTVLNLERTTIQALDNNPFRWAQAPRVAVDLLKAGQDGFLAGEAAVKSSFDDLIRHQTGLAAGSRAAVEEVLGSLSPTTIAELLKGKPFLSSRSGALWGEYVHAYEQIRGALGGGEGPAGEAFREGYEAAASARA
jgi:predicted component of type VI protein secretion system